MKLTLTDLSHVALTTLLPVYWLVGDDLSLQQEATEYLLDAARQKGFDDIERLQWEAKTPVDKLLFKLQTNGLFSTKRIIQLRLSEHKLLADGKTSFQKYLENPNPDVLLILISSKASKTALEKTWLPTIEKIGALVSLWPLSPNELSLWIRATAEKYQLSLDAEARTLLQQYHQNNLAALKQTLIKFSLLFEKNAVLGVKDIIPVLTNNSEYTVFDLVRVSLQGDIRSTNSILRNLRQHGEEPLIVLWALHQELRDLLALLEHKPQQSLSTLFASRRIWTQRQGPLKAALTRHDEASCRKLLLQAAAIDAAAKGADRDGDSVWIALNKLAYSMADKTMLLI